MSELRRDCVFLLISCSVAAVLGYRLSGPDGLRQLSIVEAISIRGGNPNVQPPLGGPPPPTCTDEMIQSGGDPTVQSDPSCAGGAEETEGDVCVQCQNDMAVEIYEMYFQESGIWTFNGDCGLLQRGTCTYNPTTDTFFCGDTVVLPTACATPQRYEYQF